MFIKSGEARVGLEPRPRPRRKQQVREEEVSEARDPNDAISCK